MWIGLAIQSVTNTKDIVLAYFFRAFKHEIVLQCLDCAENNLLMLVPGPLGKGYTAYLAVTYLFPFMSFRSQSIADVSVDASFTPEKITLFNKNADIKLTVCFSAKFRPPKQNDQVGGLTWNNLCGDRFACRLLVLNITCTLCLWAKGSTGPADITLLHIWRAREWLIMYGRCS